MRKINVIDRDGIIEMVEELLYSWLKTTLSLLKAFPFIILLALYVWGVAVLVGAK